MIWRNTALLLHIISVIVLAGGAIGGIILELTLWDTALNKTKVAGILGKAYSNFPKFATLGALLLLLTGINLLASTSWVFWGQSWLTVKLILFAFLFCHPLFTVKPAGAKLGSLLRDESMKTDGSPASEDTIGKIKAIQKVFLRFHIIQITALLLLLILATLKPILF